MTTQSGDGTDRGSGAGWRAARRAAVRRHHPDVGGSAHALLAALADVDARFGRTVTGTYHAAPPVTVRTGGLAARGRRTWRRLRRRLRAVRVRLPRHAPGSTRYIRL